MRTKEELQVWQKRWQSLNQNLNQLLAELNGTSGAGLPTDFPRRETICQLLQRLQLFGKSHFTYFYQGFLLGGQLILEEAKEYSPAAVLRSLTDQISYDLEIIQRAMDQRLIGSAETKAALKKADALGHLALQPAISAGLIRENTTILTYFQKATSVRVIPYADIAIIGLPFTAIGASQDYLAIPHEVAHYVYRHGDCGDGRAISSLLRERVAGKDEYLQKWLEETFADAYGCLVAGPVMAIDFQDLQLDDPFNEFRDADKDSEDPVPVLRPDIYTKVLAYRKNGVPDNLINLLQERWKYNRDVYLGQPGLTFTTGKETIILDNIRLSGVGIDVNKPFDDMLSKVVSEVLADVVKDTSHPSWSGDNSMLATIKTKEDLERLYEFFGQFVNTVPDLADADTLSQSYSATEAAGLIPGIANLWVEWVRKWARRNQFDPGDLMTGREPKSDKNVWGWIELAYADGWATRGARA